MNESKFLSELREMVERRATAVHLVDTLAFVEEVAERLEDDPLFGEFIAVEYSGTGRHNRTFRIHGYTRLDDSDGTLGLVIGNWSDAEMPETFPAPLVTQLSNQLRAFAAEAAESDLASGMPEANSAYELACMLGQSRSRISRIRLHILSNQQLSQRFKELQLEPVAGIPVEQHVWDLRRLCDIYQSTREREAVEISLDEFGSQGIECMQAVQAGSLESYLCIVTGNTLADMFERYGSRLLEGNVRSFLGMKGGVNKGIRRTVQDTPELFFAFNNGIAATASAITKNTVGGRAFITSFVDLQIVNGGQTTASVLNARKKDKLSLDGVSVAMKLTVVEPEQASDLIPRIAEYANTQNKISATDFFANHPFHRKMEEISRRISPPSTENIRVRSKWFYERSRGQYQNERLYLTEAKKRTFDLEFPAAQVINKTDLAKYDSVLAEKPHWISLGAQKCFLKFASNFEGRTADVTPAERWTELSPLYSDNYYQRAVAVAILWKQTEAMVSNGRGDWYEGDYRAQIVAYALALVVHGARNAKTEIDWDHIWAGQSVPAGLQFMVKKAAIEAQRVILSPPEGMRNVGEWTKKEECWIRAKAVAPRLGLDTTGEWLVTGETARTKLSDARKQGALDDTITLQSRLLALSQSGYWRQLFVWSRLGAVATPAQQSLVVRASSLSTFVKINTKDLQVLDKVRQACEDEGFRHT